jgi:anionic cell wall polymer biosynthesis LytR-Cps2A-Psr (LCP) family protein
LPQAKRTRRKAPRWARWCVLLGSLLVVAGGGSVAAIRVLSTTATHTVAQQNLLGTVRSSTERKHADVKGTKNILLVGLDTRPNQDPSKPTRSDSIMLLHIPADHSQGYLVSLPRDSYVYIPAYNNGKVPWNGGKNKINAAFAYGSRGLTGEAAVSHGFELLALTVKELTGITPDAGALIDFTGFKKVVEVLGHVCMYVDENTTSIHVGYDKDGKLKAPYVLNPNTGLPIRKVPGVKANTYTKGNHCFTPSQALDFVRQRDLLANKDADYGRQRHQQQFIKAVLEQVVHSGLTSPTKLPGLISAVGRTMTVDNGGISLEDWAFAMRSLNPSDLITVKTNDGKFNSQTIDGQSVEVLSPTSVEMLKAVKNDDIASFLTAHPDWISAS